MRYLLDTHAYLWMVEGDPNLSRPVAGLLADSANELVLSAASLWEIAIKLSIGKLRLTNSLATLLNELDRQAIEVLPIRPADLLILENLPFHHNDPFDRLIIAQALHDQIPILSKDGQFQVYGVVVTW